MQFPNVVFIVTTWPVVRISQIDKPLPEALLNMLLFFITDEHLNHTVLFMVPYKGDSCINNQQLFCVHFQCVCKANNQISIAPKSLAKPGSVERQPNRCSTAKSEKQFCNINRPSGLTSVYWGKAKSKRCVLRCSVSLPFQNIISRLMFNPIEIYLWTSQKAMWVMG